MMDINLDFDENGHATVAGTLRVFHYFSSTGEYRGWSDEFIPVGVSLPGSSTPIDPGEDVTGRAWVFDGTAWTSHEDHRDETVYSTESGQPSIIDYIGAIRAGFTTLSPETPFDKWSGDAWVIDQGAQHDFNVAQAAQKKKALLSTAEMEISWLQDAVDPDVMGDDIRPEDVALLKAWRAYRVALNRIDVNLAPDIVWPEPPSA